MHAFLLDRDAKEERRQRQRHAVKRTNLPSRHANESSDATVFPSFFQGSLLYARTFCLPFSTEIKPKTPEVPCVVIRISFARYGRTGKIRMAGQGWILPCLFSSRDKRSESETASYWIPRGGGEIDRGRLRLNR